MLNVLNAISPWEYILTVTPLVATLGFWTWWGRSA